MLAIDFGDDQKLALYGHKPGGRGGRIIPPTPPRGTRGDRKFLIVLEWGLSKDDVVTESATVGSSGCEPEAARAIVENAPHTLWTVSNRAVKNWCGRTSPLDGEAAKFIWQIATKNPAALKRWAFVAPEEKLVRRHRSVRPYDKRQYLDPQVDRWMANLPPFDQLPEHLQQIFTNGKKRTPDYSRSRALPFAMAFEEQGAESRDGYEKVIGLYAHGWPCFYRRATVALMQRVAKETTGKSKMADVTKTERKAAWKLTRRCIRELHHLTVA
jgi:hypothetical protein